MGEFFSLSFIISMISATVASIAFSVVIRVNRKYLTHAAILATVTYFIYYTAIFFGASVFLAALISTSVAAILSETLARLVCAPTIVFMLPAVIPTVPGGSLYCAMRDLLSKNPDGASEHFLTALKIGLGIAGGIVAVSIIYGSVFDYVKKISRSRKSKKSNVGTGK